MNDDLDHYLISIQSAMPELAVDTAQLNTDGMANTVVIVNGELVFRFPKHAGAHALQRYEAQLLDIIHSFLSVPVPHFEVQNDVFSMYRFLPGAPLYRHTLLQADHTAQERVITQLGELLAQMHTIPLQAAPIPPWHSAEPALSAQERMLTRLEQVQRQLYPYLWRDQKAWIEHLFAPIVDHTLDLDAFQPCFIHDDLASYHLLVDLEHWKLCGLIDFGTAGPGDPAKDLAVLINTYGEHLLRRMQAVYPTAPTLLDRARFFAGSIELEWALAGIAADNPEMFLVHLGRARDVLPIGVRWI